MKFMIELNEDLSEFREQTLTKCLSADELWEDSDGIDPKSVQGPSVFKLRMLLSFSLLIILEAQIML